MNVFIVFVWTEGLKKFAFTSVCVYNRLHVDGPKVQSETLILFHAATDPNHGSPLQERESTGASFLYLLDSKS